MKKGAILFVAMIFGITVFSEENKIEKTDKATVSIQKLQGKVVDSTNGEALVGAAVMVDGTGITVYTDFDGNFEINNAELASVSITVSLISYEKIKVNATTTSKELRVNLKPL